MRITITGHEITYAKGNASTIFAQLEAFIMHFHNVIGLRKLDALRDKGFPFHDVPVDRRSIRVDRQGLYRPPFSQRVSHITAITTALTIKFQKKTLTAGGLPPVGVLAPARNATPAE